MNYFKMLIAYVRASLRAITRNPSSLVFGFVFPLIFLVIFGLIGGRSFKVTVGIIDAPQNPLNEVLSHVSSVEIVRGDESALHDKMIAGDLDAFLKIESAPEKRWNVSLYTTAGSSDGRAFSSMLQGITSDLNMKLLSIETPPVQITHEVLQVRPSRPIDFILPGQLGFILLSAGIFGSAYTWISLRERRVLKRLFVTPAPRSIFLIGEAVSRMILAAIQISVVIAVGHFVFDFTLIHGVWTYLSMVGVCVVALIVFLGFGMMVSNIAKTEQAVPPLANLMVMPQLMLSGAFFPITILPVWLQPICRALPLTHVNDALRGIATGNATWELMALCFGILIVWGIAVFGVTIKIFRWE